MNTEIAISSAIPSFDKFFAPVDANGLGFLLRQREESLANMNKVSEFIKNECHTLGYLTMDNDSRSCRLSGISLNSVDESVKFLDRSMWKQAIALTDIYEFMPQPRREQWNESMRELEFLSFEPENVVNTMKSLLSDRDKFFAERVDGLFKGLSGSHVTNQPQGFSKRMIFQWSSDRWNSINYTAMGYLNDLRIVIAKFMQRDFNSDSRNGTSEIFERAARVTGQWYEFDGGAFKIRVYQKGTAHIEVHPDIAWRLNEVLAFLYPMAIPSEFRKPTKKKLKEFSYTQNLIPMDVQSVLASLEQGNEYVGTPDRSCRHPYRKIPNSVQIKGYSIDKHLKQKVHDILISCGGVQHISNQGKLTDIFKFDYDFMNDILPTIVCLGKLPDQKAFQFYPTCDELGEYAVKRAEIVTGDDCLEPSCGQGGIAQFFPDDVNLTCVELSNLYGDILKAKGFDNVIIADFIKWSDNRACEFDKIVMNPPFSQGRAHAHIANAMELLRVNGILVAIVPTATTNKVKTDERFECEIEHDIDRHFKGVSIEMSLIKIKRIKL